MEKTPNTPNLPNEPTDQFAAVAEALAKQMPGATRDGQPTKENTADDHPVHQMQDSLRDTFIATDDPRIDQESPAGACLSPVLAAVEWAGEGRHLFEALPHFDQVNSLSSLRAVLTRLNISTTPRKSSIATISPQLLPCLFEDANGGLFVLLERQETGEILAFDGARKNFHYLAADTKSGTAFPLHRIKNTTDRKTNSGRPWFEDILSKFRSTIVTLVLLSLVMNALSMLLPIYVMQVYDKVIGTSSIATLLSLLAGIIIAIGAEVYLRGLRTKSLAFLGGRFEALISIGVVQNLLNFPINMTESVSAGSQITRLRQFESVREAFVGPLGATLLDMPFILLFCGAVFIIGGPLGWVPVGMVIMLLTMGAIANPISTRLVGKAGEARTTNRNYLMEMTQKHGTLREISAQDGWVDRYKDVAADHFFRQFHAQQFTTTIQSIGQALVMLSGITTLFLGTHMVMNGDLTIGGMIAIMALIWRVLSPLQTAFNSLNQMGQIVSSIYQINRMMSLPVERNPGQLPTIHRRLTGNIAVAQISFRYGPRSEPALQGVALNVKPGEIVAITGGSGAGKSTLLKLLGGLYKPQAGAVLIDGLDLRQINVGEFRSSIGFAPQFHNFFYGTLLQNVQLAHPTATKEEVAKVLRDLGAGQALADLEEGLDTRFGGRVPVHLDESFRQQLSLTRAFIKDAPIYLLDEPGRNLDRSADLAFIDFLENIRGKSSVVMVTHRPSHMRLADTLVVMKAGQVVASGPPDTVLEEMAQAS